MRKLLAAFLALHGFAHLVGVTTAWRLVEPEGGFPTALLDGRVEVGAGVIYAGGAFWLLGAAVFVVAAWGVVRRRSWELPLLASAATYSLLLSAVYWPDARIGVFLNAAIGIAVALLRLREAHVGRPAATA